MKGRDWLRMAAGYLLAFAGLFWVFHDIRPQELRAAAAGLSWAWLPLAVACDVASYLAQGWRWSLLLRPLGHLSRRRATQAVYAGLFVNELLPMRPGELLRGYLVSRGLPAPWSRVIPSMLVERFLDSIWVALALAVVASLVPLPPNLVRAGEALGLFVLLATALYLHLVWRRREFAAVETDPAGPRWRRRLSRFLRHQSEGLRGIGLGRSLVTANLLTAALLVLQGLAFWIVMLACRVHLPLGAGLAVFLIVHFGTALPNAPGNMGTYQFFCVLGLALFGIDKATAAAFSLIVFVVLTVPLWILGYFCLRATGLGVSAVREEVGRWGAAAGG